MRRMLIVGSFAIAIACCASPALSERPNILLIVSEDNGPELGCYGDATARTPHLDRLAAEGVRFQNAFVPYSVCSPSRACFLTGLYPHQNGQIGLATHKFAMYREDTPNFASLFKAHGYRTGLIGKLHVNPESAFPFDFRAIPSANFRRTTPVSEYAAAAARFFNEAAQRPWFLSVNFPDAHLPFLPQTNGLPAKPQTAADVVPMPWVGVNTHRLREQVANYYNCLERLDVGVGLLLAELERAGQTQQTMVIYIGDHGAQFPRGKGTVYEGALRVPMIIRWPGFARAGHVRDELTSTLDLLPTAMRAAKIPRLSTLPGLELQPLLAGSKAPSWRRYSFAMTTGSFPRACFVQHSIRDQRFKLISSPRPQSINLDASTYLDESHPHFVISGVTAQDRQTLSDTVRAAYRRWQHPPRFELYDLSRDPYEWHDLALDPDYENDKHRLANALIVFQTSTSDPFLDPVLTDAYVREQLANRDLAYREQDDFRWTYLDTFPEWRVDRQ